MSREQIEKRIRSLFFFLFGVIFTFLFILTSSYLNMDNQEQLRQKEQVKKFLVDAVLVREKLFFEEFMTRNYNSLENRIGKFLQEFNIHNFSLIVFDGPNCMRGDEKQCLMIQDVIHRAGPEKITSFESLNKIYILFPVNAWGEEVGNLSIVIPATELSHRKDFFYQLFYYVLPFAFLVFITLIIYRFTEKNIIKPTIERIIRSEKIEAERNITKQFAHDIQSPVAALETVLTLSEEFPNEIRELVSDALERISCISKDLLKRNHRYSSSSLNVADVIDTVINDKKFEFKDLLIRFEKVIDAKAQHLQINGHDLYRVLSNLINNSIQASEGIREEIKVTISAYLDSEGIKFSVEDNGIGVPEEEIPLILSGGFSSKESGNGLGLSGAKKWIENNKGKVEVISKINHGTTINFFLPVDTNMVKIVC